MVAHVKSANRLQTCMDVIDYDTLIPADHCARIITTFVEKLDLNHFYSLIKSQEHSAGRPAIDPRLNLCLWLYATTQGVGSARALERMCSTDSAYRWICGGVHINHHTLSDFRTKYPEQLDEILSTIVSSLIKAEVINLSSVILDGTKMKANASKNSFKTHKQLKSLERKTRLYVEALRHEVDVDPEASERRIKAAKERAIFEANNKVTTALSIMPEIEALKAQRKKKAKKTAVISEAKVSTTDVDARIMKFKDGSIKAGYNCQIGIDAQSMIILNVDPNQQGNDSGQLKPLIENIEARYAKSPKRVIADSSYRVEQDIIDLAERENAVLTYSPLAKEREQMKPESILRKRTRDAKKPATIKAFKKRMNNQSSKLFMQLRTRIETINGILHNRKLSGFYMRGITGVKAELLLFAIGYNIMAIHRIGCGNIM